MNRLRAVAGLVFLVGILATPAQVLAATYTVTRADDPTPNGCQANDCSLREAVMAANSVPGSTVNVPRGTYTLTIPGADNAVTNAGIGDLDILAAMTISGLGDASNPVIVQAATSAGQGIHRIFDVHSRNAVSISGLTIRYGNDTEVASGGCIRVGGNLTLDSVVVTGCLSNTGGGGISNSGTLVVRDSVLSGNTVHRLPGNPNPVNGGAIAGGPNPSGNPPATITIVRTKIVNNTASSYDNADQTAFGGGWTNTATLTITDSIISGNTAISGGAGLNGDTPQDGNPVVAIQRTTVHGNRAVYDTGGIGNDGVMTISDSTFSNNSAGYQCTGQGEQCSRSYAGGLLNAQNGTLNVFNSTFSGNTCHISGGGILNSDGTARVYNSTIVGNTCDLGAGLTASDTTYIKNTILTQNTSARAGGDCSGNVTSQGYNIIGNTTGCSVSSTNNLMGADPKVGALDYHGGPTKTRPLLSGSAAINAGDPGGCTATDGQPLTADQRGMIRPAGGRCDIGAFEVVTPGTWAILWTTDNLAMAWQITGSTFNTNTGFGGPGPGWTAQSYARLRDGSYHVLWTRDNSAHLWKIGASGNFAGATGFGGFGPGWTATSVHFNPDGSYQVLWMIPGQARIVTVNADGSWGGYFDFSGPAGWRATSYVRGADGKHSVLWTTDNLAVVWTRTASLAWYGQQGFSGPGAGWTATSYNLRPDGSYDLVWNGPPGGQSAVAVIWSINSDGSFGSQLGLGGPAGWSVQSFFR